MIIPFRKYSSGFSFIELLVAIVLMIVVSVMSYKILNSVLENREHLEQVRDEQRKLMLAFLRLEDDLSQVRPRAIRSVAGTEIPAFVGRIVNTLPLSEPALEFTRGGIPILNDLPQSDLQRVAYRLNDEGVLFRIYWPVLDRAPTTEAIEVPILDGIEDIKMRFYDDKGNWLNVWPPVNNTPNAAPAATIPRGMEFLVKFKNGDEIKRLFLMTS